MSSKKENPRILIISSANPLVGPGKLAWDYYNALKNRGLVVDFLTKFKVVDHTEVLYVKEKKGKNLLLRVINKFRSIFTRTKALSGYDFFYKKESNPPVKTELLLKKINKPYDLVIIFFWQELLSFSTVEKIYDKLKCQMHFRCVDYSHMSGGCHFPLKCERYQAGCGCCPAWMSDNPKDFTYQNVRERERIYHKIKPVIYGNSYMQDFYKRSYLLKDYNYEWSCPIIDENEFFPMNKEKLRLEFRIPKNKKFIIFFGSQSVDSPRKGMIYLLEALSIFYDNLSEQEREDVILLVAGKNVKQIEDKLKFSCRDMGYVKFDILAKIFSLADVFLSSSIEDAGPMMVNQALSCGTPVVSFEIGTALDVVRGKGTGYCAEIKNSKDFASGIEWLFRMDSANYKSISIKCREIALKTTSCNARVDSILEVYHKYKDYLISNNTTHIN